MVSTWCGTPESKSCNHAPTSFLPTHPTPNPPRHGQNEKFTFEDLGKNIVLTLRYFKHFEWEDLSTTQTSRGECRDVQVEGRIYGGKDQKDRI
jgi:hypothetical protein